ncbi:MAG: hypothetical protein Q4B26_00340 [Eubacteriales bacterium]|nr:hypothetical protein [Eubacteriales bacterium]
MGVVGYALSKINYKRKKTQRKIKKAAFHAVTNAGKEAGSDSMSLVKGGISNAENVVTKTYEKTAQSTTIEQQTRDDQKDMASLRQANASKSLLEKSMGGALAAKDHVRKKTDERVGNLLALTGHNGLAMVHKMRSSIQTKVTDTTKDITNRAEESVKGDER